MRTEQQLTIEFHPAFNFTVPPEPQVLARRDDPETSKAAAKRAAVELITKHHGIIVGVLQAHGPLGKDGIAARSRLDGVAVCRRLKEMEKLGLIRQTGKLAVSTAGRHEREWEAV